MKLKASFDLLLDPFSSKNLLHDKKLDVLFIKMRYGDEFFIDD